jgi:hypothetical protein
VTPGARTNTGSALNQLADAVRKRGLVVLISDLFDEPTRVVRGLKHLRFRGSDVLVFHLLDHAELTFPFDRPARFRDMEDGVEVLISPADVKQGYLASIDELIADYRRELGAAGIDYQLVDTGQPLDESLLAYLATRSRRK